MAKRAASRYQLVNYVRSCRKPGSGPPGYVFQLSRFARDLGVSRQQLRLWMTGEAIPSLDHRATLHEMTGGAVDRSLWVNAT